MGQPLRVGIVGLGNISGQYLGTFARTEEVELVAVADAAPGRAEEAAGGLGGAVRALSVEALVTDPDVELVVNLTTPAAHAAVARSAVDAGKHVYGEKPLATSVAEATPVLEAAQASGVQVLCVPDTVLGTGIQTARKAIDDGWIGAPIAATATMVTPGHERWHPNPDFYYQPGGGPLLDMGPYYLTALVHLLGPVTSVVGVGSRSRQSRVIGSGPRAGEQVPVGVDTHVAGVLTHASGAITSLLMSFDAVATRSSHLEVHGTDGSLSVPDPNGFDGEVALASLDSEGFVALPASAGYRGAGRGIGIVDWGCGGRGEARTSGVMARHVLDVMESLLVATGTNGAVPIATTLQRPTPVPLGELS